MANRRAAREESWDSVHHSEASEAGDDAYDADEDMDEGDDAQFTLKDVRRVLHPLQAAADRVGRQVEEFAETLDRLSQERKGKADCNDVLPIIQEYERIAAETVKRLRRRHEPERQEKLKRSLKKRIKKASGRSTPSDQYIDSDAEDPSSTTVADLQHWEGERQTWQLLGLLVQTQFPSDKAPTVTFDERYQRPRNTHKPHRYSTEHDLWLHFLDHESAMWEKHVVVEWLKSNANSMGQDIDTVVEELESRADRGSGALGYGWLYSKEAIKNQKRMRSWPQPLEPDAPGLSESLTEKGSSKALITQLDPDAFSRQERVLATEDVFFERATWIACWEMTRRGHSWRSIREWCHRRVENWRSLSMRGDPRLAYSATELNISALSGWQSRTLWRKMCAKAAEDGGIDEYERAVYGALSGDLQSVQAVAHTWDDMLYAYYNSQLLQGFDHFVHQRFPDRVLNADAVKPFDASTMPAGADGRQLWRILLRTDTTSFEAYAPMKLLQGSMIANATRSYLTDQAYTLSGILHESGAEAKKLLRPFEKRTEVGPTATIGLEDHDILRILTHVALILQDLGNLGDHAVHIEQIIIAYVHFLGKAGKQQLLPLYASRLTPAGAEQCMARQLPSIVEAGERQTVLRLMQQYNMDVPNILLMHLVLITEDRPGPNIESGFLPLRILEPVAEGHGALPEIKQHFMGEKISGADMDLINGMEWYLLLDRHWKETMDAGALIYKYLLSNGSFSAARELSRRVPFASISLNKTQEILGESLDLAILSPTTEEPPRVSKHRRQSSPSQQRTRAQRAFLLDAAQTFRDLENLIVLLDALEQWTALASKSDQVHTRDGAQWKAAFTAAHEAVLDCAEPVLADWLTHPSTDAEAKELEQLKTAYLPEIILAYNTVLVIGGQMISRENLIRSMDLAALVANEKHGLAQCFVKAGRMAELVQAFAVSSRFMLKADEAGNRKGRGLRRKKSAEALGIWSVPSTATGT